MRGDDPSRIRWVRFAKMRSFVARIERSEMREPSAPDFASLNPGYDLSHHVKQPISFPRRVFAPFCNFASPTRIEGWAERRETFGCLRGTRGACHLASKTRVSALVTRRARRLRGALRPMTRDARLSALHRGGFGLPGPRFRLLRRPPSYNGRQGAFGSLPGAPPPPVLRAWGGGSR